MGPSCKRSIGANAIWAPVVRDPRHARDDHRVPQPAVSQRQHGRVGLHQRIAPALGPDDIGRPQPGGGVELPILLHNRLAVSISAEGHVVRRAVRHLQLVGAVKQGARHTRQAGSAIALRGVESLPARVRLAVNGQAFVDQEHARGGDGCQVGQVIAHRDKLALGHGVNGRIERGRHSATFQLWRRATKSPGGYAGADCVSMTGGLNRHTLRAWRH
jgi:hypothetical protein